MNFRFKPELFIRNWNYVIFRHDFRGVPYIRAGKNFYNKDYLHYDKERHMCQYNENGIGDEEIYYYNRWPKEGFIFSKSKKDLVTKLNKLCPISTKKRSCEYCVEKYIEFYKCPKYRDFTTFLESIFLGH